MERGDAAYEGLDLNEVFRRVEEQRLPRYMVLRCRGYEEPSEENSARLDRTVSLTHRDKPHFLLSLTYEIVDLENKTNEYGDRVELSEDELLEKAETLGYTLERVVDQNGDRQEGTLQDNGRVISRALGTDIVYTTELLGFPTKVEHPDAERQLLLF
jgi:hypothetical protein